MFLDHELVSAISGQVDPNEDGVCVLHNLASDGGPLDLVQILIDRGENPNIRGRDNGDTPLINATFWNHPEMIRALYKGVRM